jgi:transposase
MLHTGIDLHKRDLTATTVDATGEPVKTARLRATRAAVTQYFAALGPEQRAVVESTATWYRLADLLRERGVDLTLGHSKYIKAISYAKVKTDAVDAATLAQLLRSDLIPAAHMISPALRESRDLLRQRLVLVAKRTRCKNAVTGLLAQYNVATPEDLPALPRFQCALHAEQRVLLTTQIKRLERELRPTLVPDADVQRLLWIPGIGKTAAFTLYLEIDGIARFPDVRAFFSYCRLVPGAKNSGGKNRHKRMKDGNRYLKLASSHAAVRAIQYYPEIQTWYRQRLRTKGPMIARALVAKELARIAYHVLAKQQPFNGTFKGATLSRTKKLQWPRTPSPAAELDSARPRATTREVCDRRRL